MGVHTIDTAARRTARLAKFVAFARRAFGATSFVAVRDPAPHHTALPHDTRTPHTRILRWTALRANGRAFCCYILPTTYLLHATCYLPTTTSWFALSLFIYHSLPTPPRRGLPTTPHSPLPSLSLLRYPHTTPLHHGVALYRMALVAPFWAASVRWRRCRGRINRCCTGFTMPTYHTSILPRGRRLDDACVRAPLVNCLCLFSFPITYAAGADATSALRLPPTFILLPLPRVGVHPPERYALRRDAPILRRCVRILSRGGGGALQNACWRAGRQSAGGHRYRFACGHERLPTPYANRSSSLYISRRLLRLSICARTHLLPATTHTPRTLHTAHATPHTLVYPITRHTSYPPPRTAISHCSPPHRLALNTTRLACPTPTPRAPPPPACTGVLDLCTTWLLVVGHGSVQFSRQQTYASTAMPHPAYLNLP